MKKYFLILIGICIISLSFAQAKWETIIGEDDRIEQFHSHVETYDGGYGILSNSSIIDEDYRRWFVKTDINGNYLWSKIIGDFPINYNLLVTVINYPDGGNIFLGLYYEDAQLSNGLPLIIKTNVCGEKEWCRVYNSTLNISQFIFFDAVVQDNGNILVAANAYGNSLIEQIFLFNFSPDGNLLWKQPYASKDDHPIDMGIVYDLFKFGDDFLITGYCYWPHEGIPGFWLHPLFIKVNGETFEEEKVLPFGLEDEIGGICYGGLEIDENLFIGAGTHRFSEGKELVNNSMLMFIDGNGEQLKYSIIENEQIGPDIRDNFINQIQRINDTLFMASANYGEDNNYNSFGEFLIDTACNLYAFQNHDNTGVNLSDLIKTYDNKYVFATTYKDGDDYDILLYKLNENMAQDTIYNDPFEYDYLCPYPIEDGEIIPDDCILVAVEEYQTPGDYLASLEVIPVKVYPNPATEIINIEYEHSIHFDKLKLKVFDLQGTLITTQNIISGQKGSKIQIDTWNSGIYGIYISSNEKIVGKTKFIVSH